MSETAQTGRLASQIEIKLDGVKLGAEQMTEVVSIRVEQHAHLPTYFEILVNDP